MLNKFILNKAIEEAEKSDMPIFHIGAVIFKGKRIFSVGHNYKGICSKIYPKYRTIRDSTHAEQDCISKLNNWSKIKGCSIAVIRLTRSGYLSMAYPCKECMETIKHVGIKEVYYSNHNGEIILERINYEI